MINETLSSEKPLRLHVNKYDISGAKFKFVARALRALPRAIANNKSPKPGGLLSPKCFLIIDLQSL